VSTKVFEPAAAGLTVQNYFALVHAIAGKMKRRLPAHVDCEDLVQAGMVGLMEALRRFDPSRVVDFPSYANLRITGAMFDELRKWDTCSRQDRRMARQIESAKNQLRTLNGEEPQKEEIAQVVGVSLEEYDSALQRLQTGAQRPPAADEQEEWAVDVDRLPSPELSPFDECSKTETRRMVAEFMDELKPRHQQVLELYYFNDLSLKEIGEKLGVGEARVSQIHKQAVLELRRAIGQRIKSFGKKSHALFN
jgi:RNA polymerase sigma factor FliA